MKYVAPVAELVTLESVNVILASGGDCDLCNGDGDSGDWG